jgi:pyrimidine-nucleoside phosphorylase
MFYLGEKSTTVADGRKLAHQMIATGAAFEKFCEVSTLQGGDAEALRHTERLPQAKNRLEVRGRNAGFVQAINCEQVGVASLVLGGGRERKEDSIDPAVGIVLHKKLGDAIAEGESICTLHYNADTRLREAESLIHSSYRIGAQCPESPGKLIRRVIEGKTKN